MTDLSLTPVGATKRASYLELFFDLVFVFAVTQLVATLHDDHSATGWSRAALLLWLVWWAWSQYTWAANAIDLERRPTRVAVLGVAGLMLVAATTMPQAFGDDPMWFVVPYVVVRFAGLVLYWIGTPEPTHRAALRTYLPVAAIGPVLILVGGLLGPTPRLAVWGVAVLVDLGSAAAAGRGEFHVEPAHFAERHGLIAIIALGESIIAVGATATSLSPTRELLAAVAVSFVIIATLWWAYFDWLHEAAERRLADEPDPQVRGHLARDLFTLGHLPIVGGTVVFAAGVEEAVLHPDAPLDGFGRTAVAAGLVLSLVGFAAGVARGGRSLLIERLLAAGACVALVVVAGPRWNAVALLGALAAVMLLTATFETRRRPTTEAHDARSPS